MTNKLEHGNGGSAAAKPEQKKPGSRYFGLKNAAGIAGGVGGVAALILFAKFCGSGGQDRPVPPSEPVPQPPAVVCPAPQPENCNLELGEHDPHSSNWAPQKCGYCGDGIAQTWETPENCPVDFHCGDGTVQRNAVYGAYVAPSAERAGYSLGTITVTETCNAQDASYCAADCPTAPGAPAPATSDRRRDRRRDRDDTPPAATTAARPPASGGACPGEVTGRFQNRVSSSLTGNPASVRSAAGATPDTPVRARVTIAIVNGQASVQGISLSCSGCSGGSLSPGSLNVAGIPLDRSTTCTAVIPVTIPPG